MKSKVTILSNGKKIVHAGHGISGNLPQNEEEVKEKFLKCFVKSAGGCWNWTKYTSDGYGILSGNRKQRKAHRYSWVIHNGPIPKGMCVCHRCDNRKCVNPEHLFLGTKSDNTLDMFRKGRDVHSIGKTYINPLKLSLEQVVSIRKEYIPWIVTLRELAKKYGVSHSVINQVLKRRTWKSV